MSYQHASQYGLDSERAKHWIERAACRGHDPELWTLTPGEKGRQRNEAAVWICRRCPVQEQCRQYATDTESWGLIFGGERFEAVRVRTRECPRCGELFTPPTTNQRYCGRLCAHGERQWQYRERRVRARTGV